MTVSYSCVITFHYELYHADVAAVITMYIYVFALLDCPMTIADYEERNHAYMTSSSSSSSSWYSHDVRRPVSWPNMADEMTYNGCSSYPVPVDYSAAGGAAAPDAVHAAAAGAGGWSLVDLKPCITPCGLSPYTGR